MSRGQWGILAGAAAAVLLVLLVLLLRGCGGPGPPATAGPESLAGSAPLDRVTGLQLPVDLYFPDVRGRLTPQRWEVPASEDPARQIQAVVEALLAGPPAGQGLVRPLPAEVELAGVYLAPDGVAYLDLHTPAPRDPPPMGSRQEMQIVYCLVNSVALNIGEVRRVVLLWNGRQRRSLAGHLDTSRPLAPDTDLVAR